MTSMRALLLGTAASLLVASAPALAGGDDAEYFEKLDRDKAKKSAAPAPKPASKTENVEPKAASRAPAAAEAAAPSPHTEEPAAGEAPAEATEAPDTPAAPETPAPVLEDVSDSAPSTPTVIETQPSAAAETSAISARPSKSASDKRPPSRAPDRTPVVDLSRIETDDLRLLYFAPAETYLTPYVGAAFENARRVNSEVFGWRPWEKTTVLLKDFSDYGNAAARASPNDALILDIAPLSLAYETFSPGERFFTLTNHETTHVATMDVWDTTDARWRKIFRGKPMAEQEHPESIVYSFLTTPRVSVPRWYLEGSAVFMETWMAGGFGRAQGAYDEMVFRAMTRDDAHFYSPVGLETEGVAVDFQVGVNNYLYGTRFLSYLALAYSPEKVVKWLSRDEESAGYYLVQFKRVFGKSLDEAWGDWIEFEKKFQTANLAAVRQYPETIARPLTPKGLGSVSRAFVDPQSGDLVGAFRYPGKLPFVGVLAKSTGKLRAITDIKGAMLYRVTSLAYDPDRDLAWYTTDNYAFRDVVELDLKTGKKKEVLKDARIGDLVFNRTDKSLWGVRHLNGYATIVKIPAPYTSWNQIRTFDFGVTPFDLDISPDGTMLSASVGEIDGRQSVEIFRIDDLQNAAAPLAKFELGSATPEGFVFSPDGKSLYGSAYYTGVSNIYRYDIASGNIDALTNASTGFFRPIPDEDGSMIVFEYAGDGFRPGVVVDPEPLEDLGAVKFLGAEIAAQHPVVKTWTAGAPDRKAYDEKIVEEGKYVPRKEMKLAAAYPVVEGYRGAVGFGYHAIFEDPLQFNRLKVTLSYSPEDVNGGENWHADVELKTLKWRLRYWHNDADFYDLFGPTKRARAGDAVSVGYHRSIIFDPPREMEFTANLSHFMGLDTLPSAQSVATTFTTLTTLDAGLGYKNEQKSLGAVDHEKGLRWNVDAALDYANEEAFPSLRAGVDFGVPLALKNSSVWLYSAAGFVEGNSASPLSSFYFGGFGNNYVDNREVKRYREYFSFPGFDLNEISGRRFARAIAEWNLPPIRFDGLGVPSLFLTSVRPAIFGGALVVDEAAGPTRTFETVGAQVDWSFTFAHRLPMVFSAGYAEGFEEGTRRGGELLLSLKIM